MLRALFRIARAPLCCIAKRSPLHNPERRATPDAIINDVIAMLYFDLIFVLLDSVHTH